MKHSWININRGNLGFFFFFWQQFRSGQDARAQFEPRLDAVTVEEKLLIIEVVFIVVITKFPIRIRTVITLSRNFIEFMWKGR
jgi:hypothetical protein